MLDQAGVWLLVPYPQMKQAFFLITIIILIMSKLTKMSLSNIQGVLSREEMSKIMAGSGSTYCGSCKTLGSSPGGGATESCFTDPTLGGACMGCEGLCY